MAKYTPYNKADGSISKAEEVGRPIRRNFGTTQFYELSSNFFQLCT
jgi:hypothetical protein